MAKINFKGVEWDLDYFVKTTFQLEENLGDNPSPKRKKRVEERFKAIEESQSPPKKKSSKSKKTKQPEELSETDPENEEPSSEG